MSRRVRWGRQGRKDVNYSSPSGKEVASRTKSLRRDIPPIDIFLQGLEGAISEG